jgi:hypothetical protein
MSSTVYCSGRLCNQIIRNICTSILAKKNDLYVEYSSYDLITKLGIKLFTEGEKRYSQSIIVTDDNYLSILNQTTNIDYNIYTSSTFFQTTEITHLLYNYLHDNYNKNSIIESNPFKSRYSNNNDCFIHIRLGDMEHLNPGFDYFNKAISQLPSFDKLYIGTDSPENPIIQKIVETYPSSYVLPYGEVETIQFASTNKHIILSHGSFSAFIGWISFYSNVYYPSHSSNEWYGKGMFSIPSWNCVSTPS